MIRIAEVSTEYIRARLTSNVDIGTLGVVSIAFTASQDVAPTTWHAAEIDGDAIRLLIGPGAVVVPKGIYSVWARLNDVPEVPVEIVGLLEIF